MKKLRTGQKVRVRGFEGRLVAIEENGFMVCFSIAQEGFDIGLFPNHLRGDKLAIEANFSTDEEIEVIE